MSSEGSKERALGAAGREFDLEELMERSRRISIAAVTILLLVATSGCGRRGPSTELTASAGRDPKVVARLPVVGAGDPVLIGSRTIGVVSREGRQVHLTTADVSGEQPTGVDGLVQEFADPIVGLVSRTRGDTIFSFVETCSSPSVVTGDLADRCSDVPTYALIRFGLDGVVKETIQLPAKTGDLVDAWVTESAIAVRIGGLLYLDRTGDANGFAPIEEAGPATCLSGDLIVSLPPEASIPTQTTVDIGGSTRDKGAMDLPARSLDGAPVRLIGSPEPVAISCSPGEVVVAGSDGSLASVDTETHKSAPAAVNSGGRAILGTGTRTAGQLTSILRIRDSSRALELLNADGSVATSLDLDGKSEDYRQQLLGATYFDADGRVVAAALQKKTWSIVEVSK